MTEIAGNGAGSRAMRVTIDGLRKSFGTTLVVRDLTLTVEPGEFLVLLGPSGCGKTTALRMVAGLESVDAGSIRIGTRDVTHVLPKYRDVAMVFQSYALYPHKTVAENIGYPLKVRNIARQERDRLVTEAARQVHLDELLDRYPRQLSGGQRQRVALARAIIRRPAAFLMDEPLSNLDAKLRGYMRAELKHMQHELGVTTIYVTHDQIEAMTLAHRVAILEQGVLQRLDTPRNIYNAPANLFVAGFIGSPPMNFVNGRVASGRFEANGLALPVAAPDVGEAVLGVRAEDATVVPTGQGDVDCRVYAAELTGDHTLVTVTVGDDTLTVKMDKSYDVPIDSGVGVKFDPAHVFVFDAATGVRVWPALQVN